MDRRLARAPSRALQPLALLLAVAAWLVPGMADAQAAGPRLHIGIGAPAINFGGEGELNDGDFDLDATLGIRGHLDYAVHRHISIGGMTRLSWWEPDDWRTDDRNFLFDIGPRLIGHYDWRDFRFYGGIAPGLTVSALDDDRADPAVGFTLSLTVAGMEYWFARRVGAFVELGWVGHWFEHEYDGGGEAEIGLSQGLFEFGIVFGV